MRIAETIDRFITKPDQRKLILLILAIAVGLIGGLGAVVFRILINFFNEILFQKPSSLFSDTPIIVVLAPLVGGLMVGALVYYGAREAKGHGVPEIIESVNLHNGRMRWRIPFIKILASAITIGSGGSAGREGPIAQIGGGFASVLAQKMHLSRDDSKTLVIAGVSAGIAATFNAPLGGVLFGYEVIRRDRKTFSIVPLIISSVVGTTVGDFFLGTDPAFVFPDYRDSYIFGNIPLYILLGIFVGLFSVFWVKGFYLIEDLLEKIKISPILLAGLGGILVGVIELFVPEVHGISYQPIDDAFNLQFSIKILIILTLAKLVATSLSIGSGGSGGVFAPSLFQGVMLGTAFGLIVHSLGYTSASVGIYSMLGMAALFAGSARAPLTAIIMTSEMVNDFHLILPLMFTVVTAWLVSGIFLKDDIYTIKLIRRGVSFTPAVDILDEVMVAEVMIRDPITVSPKDRIESVLELMFKTNHTGFPVVRENKLIGIITEHDVDHALNRKSMAEWSVDEVCTKKIHTVRQDCPLSEVFVKMGVKNVNRLPVIDEEQHLIGWITRSDVMRIYLQQKKINLVDEYESDMLDGL